MNGTQAEILRQIWYLLNTSLTGNSNVDITGNSAGLATGSNINTLQTTLGTSLNNIDIDTSNIDLKLANVLTSLTNILNRLSDNTQTSRVTDGTDTLNINTDGSININPISTTRTLVSTNVTTSGSISAGNNTVSFETSSDFTGSINGLTRSANRQYSFSAPFEDTLNAISYTIITGSINIDRL